MSDQQIGLQARLMSKALRRITGSLASTQTTVIFINQLRSKVGTIFGSPEVTTGGNALKFYASVRLDTRRKEMLPLNVGIRVKVKVVKNKIAPPFQEVYLDILFGSGVDTIGCLVDSALMTNLLNKRGSWYFWKNENIGQGRQAVVEYLNKNEDVTERIRREVILAWNLTKGTGKINTQKKKSKCDRLQAEDKQ